MTARGGEHRAPLRQSVHRERSSGWRQSRGGLGPDRFQLSPVDGARISHSLPCLSMTRLGAGRRLGGLHRQDGRLADDRDIRKALAPADIAMSYSAGPPTRREAIARRMPSGRGDVAVALVSVVAGRAGLVASPRTLERGAAQSMPVPSAMAVGANTMIRHFARLASQGSDS